MDPAEKKARELEAALTKASQNGKYPILVDTSPCLHHMKETFSQGIDLDEPMEFTLKV